jgi:hypothetical protein
MQSSNPKIVEAADHLVDIFGQIKLIENADVHGLDSGSIYDYCDTIRKKLIKALEALKD